MNDPYWLALMIGNSRLHWAGFEASRLVQRWDTPHLDAGAIARCVASPQRLLSHLGESVPASVLQLFSAHASPAIPLWLASVVPQQLQDWQHYPHARVITLQQIPLRGSYASLGIDRALAVWGAFQHFGTPTLVIDGGTALTFTGLDGTGGFVGGAILPGLGLQGRSLHEHTASLPQVEFRQALRPAPWATDTVEAIQSGIFYTVLAGMRAFAEDWWQRYADGTVVLTGGDRDVLAQGLEVMYPAIAPRIQVDPDVIFYGIRALHDRQSPQKFST